MKILQIIHKLQNRGAETFASQISNHLMDRGHEVRIISLFTGTADLPFRGKILVMEEEEKKNGWQGLKLSRRIARVIEEFNPDIVQTNAGDTLKYTVFSKKIFRWKNLVVVRNASEVGRYFKSPLHKLLNSFFYKKINFAISVSHASEKDLLKNFPFLRGRTSVIPVGLEQFHSPIKPIRFEPNFKKHIIHIGGFTFEKNHKGLISIFSKLTRDFSEVHLHLVGDGPLKGNIENEVKKRGLKNVTFYGFVNDPLSYISGADLLVLPSIIEGLPGVLLESMICKTPVVAYNVGGIGEIVTSETGKIVPLGEENEFVDAILFQLKTPSKIQIDKAYNMVRENYINQNLALDFENLYKKWLQRFTPN